MGPAQQEEGGRQGVPLGLRAQLPSSGVGAGQAIGVWHPASAQTVASAKKKWVRSDSKAWKGGKEEKPGSLNPAPPSRKQGWAQQIETHNLQTVKKRCEQPFNTRAWVKSFHFIHFQSGYDIMEVERGTVKWVGRCWCYC